MSKWEKVFCCCLPMRSLSSKVYAIHLLGERPIYSLFHLVAITVYEDIRLWAVAGDQVLFTLANVDLGNIR